MGGPRRATAPKVTTTPAPETAVVPAPVADDDAQTPNPGADTGTTPDPVTPDAVHSDPVTPDSTPAPDAATAAPTPPDAPAADDTAVEPVDVTEIVMNIAITGTVDGEPWPAPGGEISLPTAEAERYVRLGYAHFPEK